MGGQHHLLICSVGRRRRHTSSPTDEIQEKREGGKEKETRELGR